MEWQQQRLKAPEEIAFYAFYDRLRSSSRRQQVPLAQVTGSNYFGAYVGDTWQQMRANLKRTYVTEANCHDILDYPHRYRADELLFLQFGREYIICQGHHRTCLARFLGREFVPAWVVEYPFDQELFDWYEHFRNVGFQVDWAGGQGASLRRPLWRLTTPALALDLVGREGIASFGRGYGQLAPDGWRNGLLAWLSRRHPPAATAYAWPADSACWSLRAALAAHRRGP